MKFNRVLIYLITSLVLIGVVVYSLGLRYNFTPSFARGFYLIQDSAAPYEQGDLVIFCPPDSPAFKLASEREYVSRGVCGAGDYRPMMKRVIGVSGDTVIITDENVRVNGTIIDNSTIKTHD